MYSETIYCINFNLYYIINIILVKKTIDEILRPVNVVYKPKKSCKTETLNVKFYQFLKFI